MKSILKNSNGKAVSTSGKLFTVSANYTDQLKQATNWSAYADIIVPLSTLVE